MFLPKGAHIDSTTISEGRIVVTFDLNGATEVRFFDLKTLQQIGQLHLPRSDKRRSFARTESLTRGHDGLRRPFIGAIRGAGSLRLAAQDVALSRRKQGFESPRERQLNQVFSAVLDIKLVFVRKLYGTNATEPTRTRADDRNLVIDGRTLRIRRFDVSVRRSNATSGKPSAGPKSTTLPRLGSRVRIPSPAPLTALARISQ